jgi:PD-(D/E)XK nuclease superfamily
MNDTTIRTIKEANELPYSDLTGAILGCCFDVMKELGPGFLDKVYKNSLLPIGLLVNFRRRKLEWKRLQSNDEYFDIDEILESSMQL